MAVYTYPNAKDSSSSIKCSSSVNINRYFSRDLWRHPAPQRSCQDRTQFVVVTWHLTVLVQFTVNTLACPVYLTGKYPCSPDTFHELFCLCDIYPCLPWFSDIYRPLLAWQLPCLSDMYPCLRDSYPAYLTCTLAYLTVILLNWHVPLLTWQLSCLSDMYPC